MKHVNIFVVYKGRRTVDEMLKKVDGAISFMAGLDSKDTESYFVPSDIDLPDEVLEKLYFATQVYPHKINGKTTEFNYRFSFFNLPIDGDCSDVKYCLEERGFEFKPLSENEELLSAVFHWYLPVNHDGECPARYKRSYRKKPTQAYVLPITMD